MQLNDSNPGKAIEPQPDAAHDAVPNRQLEQALANFRQSVHAWSEAEYRSEAEFSRPRTVAAVPRRAWRPALAWALGCMVVAGTVSGGIYDHHRAVMERQLAASRIAQQRQLAEQQKAQEDESLLANVDTDISRSVPAAMEPLAQLMDDGTN